MKYKIVIKQGFMVIAEGEIEITKLYKEELKEGDCNSDYVNERCDEVLFDIEKAINSETDFRAHIDRADSKPKKKSKKKDS